MAYRFKLQEPIAQEVRRVALEQIDIAEEKLASKDDVASAIHDARRCLKRLRALIRLVRPALGEAVYRRESERVASTGQLLAGARDVHVMRLTAAKLESRFGPLPDGGGKRLRRCWPQMPPRSHRVLARMAGRRPSSVSGKRASSSPATRWTALVWMHSPRDWSAATARGAGASAKRSASPPTSPSTPGASPRSDIGGTCS